MRLARFNVVSACILLGTAWLLLSAVPVNASEEAASTLADIVPFKAQYRLETRNWPSATITHTLSQEGQHWLSDMRFSLAIVSGQEYSRFFSG